MPKLSNLTEPELQILLSLVDAELHGYAILLEIRERTAGAVDLATGTLYVALRRLRGRGWVEDAGVDAGNSRRLYRMTARGREALDGELARLHRILLDARAKDVFPHGASS